MKINGIYRSLLLIFCVTFFVSVANATHSPITATMGTWKSDSVGKKKIVKAQMIPGYNYYYSGPIDKPDSVMALSKKYNLYESNFWKEASDVSDKVLKGWMQAFKKDGHVTSDMSGGVILDQKGRTIGYWLSRYSEGSVTFLDNGKITVSRPSPSNATRSPITATMGTWKSDSAGKERLERAIVLPECNYYYIGPIDNPDSVMALSKKYKLHESNFWAKANDVSDKALRGWMQSFKNDGYNMNGGVILDQKGKEIGYWLSLYSEGSVMFLDNGEIAVSRPHPATGPVRPGQGS